MSSFSAIFRLKAVDDGMSSTIDAAKAKVGGIGGALGGALKSSVGRIFSASAAMTMLKGTMEEVLNRAKQYNNLGMRMGLPATEVAKLDKAAEQAGINVSSLGRGMMLVQKFGAEGLAGTTERAKALTAGLKLSRAELEAMKQGGKEGLAVLADKMKGVADEGARDAMGIKVLGEKYFELKQLIDQGGDAIRSAGGDQATWGEETQDMLSRTQRAWANMWNELSVMVADAMRDFEPLIGFLRVLINMVMPAIRLALWGIAYVIDAIQYGLLGAAYYWNKIFGSAEDVEALGKAMEQIDKKQKERNEKLKEGVKRDMEGIDKGAKQMVGADTGNEGYKGKPPAAQTTETRTMEEQQAYEAALKKQKEINIERQLENATEEEKLRLMAEQLMLMKAQEKIIKEKHPTMFEKTAEWLELQNKIEAHQKKMRKERRDQDIAESKREYDIAKSAAKRRLDLMKANGATEEEIFREEFAMKQAEIVRLGDELHALQRDEFATNEDRRKKLAEIAESMGEADVMLAKREKDMAGKGTVAVVDSLQKIGGGGSIGIAPLNVAKQSLTELQRMRRNAELQTKILSEKLGYNLSQPVYGR